MVIAEEKVELRKYFKRLRSQLTAEQAAAGSLLTARQILACDAYRKANCIMGYLAFGNELSVSLTVTASAVSANRRSCCSRSSLTLYWCPEWPSAATAADWGWARAIMTVFCRRRKTHCSWASLTMLLFSRICRGMNLTCLYSF